MCGRFVLFSEAENEEISKIVNEITTRLNQEEAAKLKTGEIFPTDYVPIIAANGNKKVIGLAKWGFPNFKNNGVIINARGETLEEKPTFRKILYTKRCVIPASGYYEWKETDGNKEKYLIRTEKPLFYMAGLYNNFIDKDNKPYIGFVIITVEPNGAVSHIHDRMPAILAHDSVNTWLTRNDIGTLKKILIPYGSEGMTAVPVAELG